MRTRRRLSSHLCSQNITTNVLRLLWLLIVFWGELGVFFSSRFWCRWPRHEATGTDASRVLLLTDPQIRTSGSFSMFPSARTYVADQYLRKSWHVVKRLKPDAIFFLGDMLRDGKSAKNSAQYAGLVGKFKSIFALDASTPIYYLPGNNDVGMGHVSSPNLRAYFEEAFGTFNQIVTLNNHTFLALDAPGLVDEDYQRNARGISFDDWEPNTGGAVDTVRRVADQHYQPLILLSHIPLYRSDVASCGPLREKGTIHRGVGYGYQNTLGKQTTAFLLRALQPAMIFSGDNRDYCEYVHKGSSFEVEGLIPEITVKSFSLTPQIRRPGLQLLSVVDPSYTAPSQSSILHRPCLLPKQSAVFAVYFWWSIATLFILLILNFQRIKNLRLRKQFRSFSPTQGDSSILLQDSQGSSFPVWSPHTPFMAPKSPRPQIPSPFRSPGASASPMLRASSRPMTPQNHETPMPSSQLIPTHDGEDLMFPDQYVTQRDTYHPGDEEWVSIGREEPLDSSRQISVSDPRLHPAPSQFISAPGNLPTHRRRQSNWKPIWSRNFVWGGRRRRFVFAVPRPSIWWEECKGLSEILRDADQRTIVRRRRGIIMSTLFEGFAILWPAGIFWLIVNFFMF
ncbi:hypothetical protein AGABI1DRAFT_119597 [Agaricus bisporus var. burnettii JB137-S8]|uniref:Calcineurin-like phosphoesterase domain-containing protein n=1 Tax=Agaricus bisporus var. burnettii (strain JB137-S8 / ATCC MYA-4627 / FGSC 10392) TaxID=597362 RepID=K5XD65_AGABU|nr:uncharacterized protein AGABI1DRAFT_119597 [Agaricus bisporus var. burnettii JB137-S8]EKM81067.1 hypothetical protein AGABI1DRAFT_119597 [Agaricus bisporus var. burnettii JB137-S8]